MDNWTKMYEMDEKGAVRFTEEFFTLPEIMREDTQCGNKEKYQDVAALFDFLSEKITEETAPVYLAMAVDTLEQMSMQIYEHYRKLQDAMKSVLHRMLEKKGITATEELAYAILKACRLELLLKEKYVPVGLAMAETLPESNSTMMKKVKEESAVWKSN